MRYAQLLIIAAFLFESCSPTNSGKENFDKEENEEKITYRYDEKEPSRDVSSLSVMYSTGFDEITTIKLLVNDSILGKVKCKTDYSLGVCLLDTPSENIAYAYIDHSFIEQGDVVKIETDSNYISFVFTDEMKNFNRLIVDKSNPWQLLFINSSANIYLE